MHAIGPDVIPNDTPRVLQSVVVGAYKVCVSTYNIYIKYQRHVQKSIVVGETSVVGKVLSPGSANDNCFETLVVGKNPVNTGVSEGF